MIASMIAKQMARSYFEQFNKDDFDVNAAVATMTDDCVFDHSSEIGPGETRKGKKAEADWFRRWKEEFPKRKFVVKNICFSAWPLCPTNVCMVEWSLTETNKEGKEFKYDGISVSHTKNFKMVRGADYIAFAGLPQLSNLIKPTAKA